MKHREGILLTDKALYKRFFLSFFEMMEAVCENEGVTKDIAAQNALINLLDTHIMRTKHNDLIDVLLFQQKVSLMNNYFCFKFLFEYLRKEVCQRIFDSSLVIYKEYLRNVSLLKEQIAPDLQNNSQGNFNQLI